MVSGQSAGTESPPRSGRPRRASAAEAPRAAAIRKNGSSFIVGVPFVAPDNKRAAYGRKLNGACGKLRFRLRLLRGVRLSLRGDDRVRRRVRAGARAGSAAERLTLDLDGWEGPLDLLLTLARTQKVDLAKISILALVEQYLAFIADAKKLRLEIAADYLVMAAWLAYLKSCLLLPKEAGVDPAPRSWRCGCSSGFSGCRRCARRGRG